jgi:hypothetical protein
MAVSLRLAVDAAVTGRCGGLNVVVLHRNLKVIILLSAPVLLLLSLLLGGALPSLVERGSGFGGGHRKSRFIVQLFLLVTLAR